MEKVYYIASIITAIFTAISALSAAFAAISASKSARESRSANRARLIESILEFYASKEVLESMLALRKWFHTHNQKSAEYFANYRQNDYEKIKKSTNQEE